jgi:hypothetical protein
MAPSGDFKCEVAQGASGDFNSSAACAASCQAPVEAPDYPTIPAVDELLYGFNLASMNASTQRLLYFSYGQHQIQPMTVYQNKMFLIPDNVEVTCGSAESVKSTTKSYSSFDDVLTEQRLQLGVQISFAGGGASLSTGYEHMKHEMDSKNVTMSQCTAQLELFRVVNTLSPLLDATFVARIRDLPQYVTDDEAKQKYMSVFHDYGTHYTRDSWFGGYWNQVRR